ncbi:hypothetical protein DFH09DRAFT_935342, partial [Mycena vulgaris]
KIINWLSPINFFPQQADVARSRKSGTGDWLLAHHHFQQWEAGSGGTLWCRGIPGAGKTVLASMVVEYLCAQYQNRDIGVACIYLNHKETHSQTPSNLLAGLWRQLVFGKSISSLVQQMYQRHSEKQTRPSLDDIHQVLRSAVNDWAKVYIVVDALDEYPEDERFILLQRLISMGPTVGLLLTSRPHISLAPPIPCLEAVEIRANEDDVRRYLMEQINVSQRLSKHVEAQPGLQQEIMSSIMAAVDGM